MDSWSYGLSNVLDKDDVKGFSSITKVGVASSSSSCVVPSCLLHANNDGTSSGTKKPRASSSCSQNHLCQVYGCNMDLSSSKDYHKRHRVCEAHSKTSVVIVNGIEQRFCQQCSRFHFLSEFDSGKRSCRKRLAGHNERRRKPSFYFLPGKQRHKLLPQESFPGSFLYRVMGEDHHHRASRLVSFKDEEPMFPAHNRGHESKPAMEASGEAAPPGSTCAHSLLSALQSQQHFSETPNKSFSITQPNQSLSHSTIGYHQMQPPLRTDHGKTKTSSSSTVDLLQLSSHLRRIQQQQRNFTTDVKHEYINDLYFP